MAIDVAKLSMPVPYANGAAGAENKEPCAIDLRCARQAIEKWAKSLSFKPRLAGKHFKKHGAEPPLGNPKSSDEYVAGARQTVINAIFAKGFAVRTGRSDRVAFFDCANGNFPAKMTSVGYFDKYNARIMTHYASNLTTPYKTAVKYILDDSMADKEDIAPDEKNRCYVAYFEDGKTQGWQPARFEYQNIAPRVDDHRQPARPLHPSINFMGLIQQH